MKGLDAGQNYRLVVTITFLFFCFFLLAASRPIGASDPSFTFLPQPEDQAFLNKYYRYDSKQLTRYKRWIKRVIDITRKKGTYGIVVDKSTYTLFLLKNGMVCSQYPVELGFNPVQDKIMEGDGCTPEGVYYVLSKRVKENTLYYKALLLNYPVSKDLREFECGKENGVIPEQAEVGGCIEIHGQGSGKRGNALGSNWTMGCIALENKDIDDFFLLVEVGTPVAIVKYCDNSLLYHQHFSD